MPPATDRIGADLWRALGSLTGPPSPERERVAGALELGPLPDRSDYTDLFVLGLQPYASIYLGPEGMLGGEARDRIAGFWQAVGRTPPSEPDHLALLLGLYGSLVEEEGEDAPVQALTRHARTALFHEHLAPWLFPWLLKMEEEAGPFHRRWARLLRRVLEEEAEVLGAASEMPGAEAAAVPTAAGLPAHLAQAPPALGVADDDLSDRLLTPVRSGLILTRSDLARASRERGLPLRIGERRFALRNMLQAAPDDTVAWLRKEAVRWSQRHRRWEAAGGAAARFWRERAERTARVLA